MPEACAPFGGALTKAVRNFTHDVRESPHAGGGEVRRELCAA